MTAKNDMLTVYAKHLVLNFGNDAMAMFYSLPDFEAEPFGDAIFILAETANEGDTVLLRKIAELYAVQAGVAVIFNGQRIEPAAMLRAA